MKDLYDLAVLGAGPGGYTAALEAARLGLSVAVVEKDLVGGTCLNRGCIPTKALLHAACSYRERRTSAYGLPALLPQPEEAGGDALLDAKVADGVDTAALFQACRDAVRTLREGIERSFQAGKIDLFRAEGRLSQGAVTLVHPVIADPSAASSGAEGCDFNDGDAVHARDILLAAGSVPSVLPIPGIDLPGVLTSDELLAMDSFPESIVIIGGGAIGCEFADMLSSFGVSVTVLEALPRLLANMDKEISQSLKMQLKKRRVDVHTGVSVTGIESAPDGMPVCEYTENGETCRAAAQYVLCAAGRRALSGQFPQLAGERGRILVDGCFATSVPHVYAIGDITPGPQLAHKAEAEARQAVRAIARAQGRVLPAAEDIDTKLIPACVYTEPEIASTGLTEAEAAAAGLETVTGKAVSGANARSVISGDPRGFMKVVVQKGTGRILGAQFMCARASDMIAEMTLAIANGLTAAECLKAVRAHPTYEEMLTEALDGAAGKAAGT
ncbi:MAG: FAD-dependent oxidoreductase [Lachnospiraceae bacterium]|jgi:dihydrolipoamide dehydrogenase|nr:FAD-dependent oxidoreductase [Lachnospiraceae bacterium]